jgi:hypothetical protein
MLLLRIYIVYYGNPWALRRRIRQMCGENPPVDYTWVYNRVKDNTTFILVLKAVG